MKSELVEYTGHEQIITFNFSEQQFLGKFTSTIDIQMDKDLKLNIDLNQVSLFDKAIFIFLLIAFIVGISPDFPTRAVSTISGFEYL